MYEEVSEDSRRKPKIFQDFRGRPDQRCFDHTLTNLLSTV